MLNTDFYLSYDLGSKPSLVSVRGEIKEFLGFSSADLLSGAVTLESRVHPDDGDLFDFLFGKEWTVSGSFTIRLRQANGLIRIFRLHYAKSISETVETLDLTFQDAKKLHNPSEDLTANFKSMMDNTDDYIFFKDRNHIFTGASQTLVALCSPAEHWLDLVGQTDYDVFPEAFADIYYRLEKLVFSGSDVAHEVQRYLTNDGIKGWVDNRKYPIKDSEHNIIGLFGVARDITELKNNEEELLFRKFSLDHTQESVFWFGKDGRIIDVNETACVSTGYVRDDLLKLKIFDISSRYSTVSWREHWAEVKESRSLTFESLYSRNDGSDYPVEVVANFFTFEGEEYNCAYVRDVTHRKQQMVALQNVNDKLFSVMQTMRHNQLMMERTENLAHLASFEWEVDENLVTWSPEMYRIFGRDPELGVPNLEGQAELYTPQSTQILFDAVNKAVTDGTPYRFELVLVRPTGEKRPCYVMGFPERDDSGRVIRLAGLVQDITDRKKAEHELSIAATAFNSQEGMTVTDAQGIILKVNNSFIRITGYSSDEAVGKSPRILKSGKHDEAFYKNMWQKIEATGVWEGEIWNRRKNGEIYPEYLTITAVKDSEGVVSNYVGTFIDITQSKASAEEIKNLAFFDPLTNLPNRRLLLDRMHKNLAARSRHGNHMALLFLDLDNFKTLNDTLGHDIGDLLLKQVAARLIGCVREGDTVARLGGDEFVVMLDELSKIEVEAAGQADSIAKKILDKLNETYQLNSHTCTNTPSIGITIIGEDGHPVDELFKQADLAMYQSKKAGRNTISFFDRKMEENLKARFELENDLRNALAKNELRLFFQIQMDNSNHPVGAEALIRWQDPKRGLVAPIDFIPHAEESGQILPIGKWVIETALDILKHWQQDQLTRDLVLSVNVSARQFHQPHFVDHISERITALGINPAKLKLELTESLLLSDVEDAISKMNELNDIGIRLSLDDFGTGYSSLLYLKRLPLQQLKIDKSFVQDIESDGEDRAIVSTIIAMASNLSIEVIAEGVETKAQKDFLLEKGCERFQGYLFGKPIPIEDLEISLRQFFKV